MTRKSNWSGCRVNGYTSKVARLSPFREKAAHTINVTRKANIRGKVLETSYLITEHGGKLFIETGFAILLTYDKERDRIILSPGGEYKRVFKH